MKRYTCKKDNKNMVSCDLNYLNIDGFKVKPKNQVKYDGVEVNRLTITSPLLIQNVLKRKTKRKLNAYLEFLFTYLDDDDTSDDDLNLIIDDVKRYKALIINKYSKFLDVNYIKQLLLRVNFVESELKKKIQLQDSFSNNMRRGR